MGRNVAAGMTGGLAYILDEDDTLIPKVLLLADPRPHSSQKSPDTKFCYLKNSHIFVHLFICSVKQLTGK